MSLIFSTHNISTAKNISAVLLTAIVLLFSQLLSASPSLPMAPCNGRDCSTPMLSMVNNFYNGSVITGQLPVVASGSCYHASVHYSSSKEHYGVIYLLNKEGSNDIYFNGSFGFFFDQNPYADITTANAQQKFTEPFKKSFVTENGNLVADYSTQDTLWIHFLRHNSINNRYYLISYFGVSHMMTCELTPH